MATAESLYQFLAGLGVGELSQRAQILVVAYFMRSTGRIEFTTSALAKEFKVGALPLPGNLGVRLSQLARGKAASLIRVGHGRYSLSLYGVEETENFVAPKKPRTSSAADHLERFVARLSDKARQRFLVEAVACLHVGAKRASVVMTWLVAFDHLSEYIVRHRLDDFNVALAKRKGTTPVKDRDGLADLKESDVIGVARSAGIITQDVRKILDEKLGIRNSCAHPSDIEIHETKVINVVEDLVDNVITKYKL